MSHKLYYIFSCMWCSGVCGENLGDGCDCEFTGYSGDYCEIEGDGVESPAASWHVVGAQTRVLSLAAVCVSASVLFFA